MARMLEGPIWYQPTSCQLEMPNFPVPDDFELTSVTHCPHDHDNRAPKFVCWEHSWAYDQWYNGMRRYAESV